MIYSIGIIGHGNYPYGVRSALKLLAGTDDNLSCFNLNDETTHEQFKKDVSQFLDKNESAIIVADMTGGAPFQSIAEIILEENKKNHYIISSLPMNAILDIYLKNSMDQLSPDNIEGQLDHIIKESVNLMQFLPSSKVDSATQDDKNESGEDGWI